MRSRSPSSVLLLLLLGLIAATTSAAAQQQQAHRRSLSQAAPAIVLPPTVEITDVPVIFDNSTTGNLTDPANSTDSGVTGGGLRIDDDNPNKAVSSTLAAGGEPLDTSSLSPLWPAGKAVDKEDDLLIDLVTDSPPETVVANQIPLIQSLANQLQVSTESVYFYNATTDDGLQTYTFIVDTDSPTAKQSALKYLASPTDSESFYANALAYEINILNGPNVASSELDLGTDVISTPDDQTAYDGDTGLIRNNESTGPAPAAPAANGTPAAPASGAAAAFGGSTYGAFVATAGALLGSALLLLM